MTSPYAKAVPFSQRHPAPSVNSRRLGTGHDPNLVVRRLRGGALYWSAPVRMAMPQTETHVDLEPEQAFQRILQSVRQHAWTILDNAPDRGTVRARTGGNLLSWGEEVTAHVAPDHHGSVVVVESHPIAQVFDFGRSRQNIVAVIAGLAQG